MLKWFGLFLFWSGLAHAQAAESNPIANFHVVTDGIYRGAMPDARGIAYLESIGVHTDLDLQSLRPEAIDEEKNAAKKASIAFFNEPLLTLFGIFIDLQPDLNPVEMDTIMSIVGDSANDPLFIHCTAGEDRTGLVVGLYRVLYEKWTPQAAWAEMLEYGYHPEYEVLTRYFAQKTGWTPPSVSNL